MASDTSRVEFGGLRFCLAEGWVDVTDHLELGSPPTLAKANDGYGALQFSLARYRVGRRPDVRVQDLRELIYEFARTQELGEPKNLTEEDGESVLVFADIPAEKEFLRIWYLTSGNDVALVTYIAQQANRDVFDVELGEAQRMVGSATFA